jgi:hypothetical protein
VEYLEGEAMTDTQTCPMSEPHVCNPCPYCGVKGGGHRRLVCGGMVQTKDDQIEELRGALREAGNMLSISLMQPRKLHDGDVANYGVACREAIDSVNSALATHGTGEMARLRTALMAYAQGHRTPEIARAALGEK